MDAHISFSIFAQKLFEKLYKKYELNNKLECYLLEDSVIKRALQNVYVEEVTDRLLKLFVFDINTRRINKQFLEIDDKKQYQEFINLIGTENYERFMKKEYPNTWSNLINFFEQLVENFSDFEEHLEKDIVTIKTEFDVHLPIISLTLSMGDHHRRHQSVFEISFENDSIFYKPINGNNIDFFQKILNWLNNNGLRLTFRIPKTVQKSNYIWQKKILIDNTASVQISDVYYQFGVLSCISELFAISDLHKENIMVSKGYLYLIDCEATSDIEWVSYNKQKENTVEDPEKKWFKEMKVSIAKTALFPLLVGKSNGKEIDSSGLTAHEGQIYKKCGYQCRPAESSYMKLQRRDVISKKTFNIPSLKNGKAVNPQDYIKDIIRGFNETYTLILKERRFFLENQPIWSSLKESYFRVVLRDTQLYVNLIDRSSNPGIIEDTAKKSEMFYKFLLPKINDLTILKSIIPSEIRDMLNGDIPFFYKKANDRFVYDSYNTIVYKFQQETIYENIIDNIKKMSTQKLKRENQLIEIALNKSNRKNMKNPLYIDFILKGDSPSVKEDYLDQILLDSSQEGIQLVNNAALIFKEKVIWEQIDLTKNQYPRLIHPCDVSLYSGLAGFALVYAYLFRVTNKQVYRQYLIYCLNEINYIVENMHEDMDNPISVYEGYGGLVYLNMVLYKTLNEQGYLKQAMNYLKKIEPILKEEIIQKKPEDFRIDYVGGVSGLLTVCCHMYDMVHLNYLKEIIQMCVSIVLKGNNKLQFLTSENNYGVGMAHGLCGIAYGLSQAYTILGRQEIIHKTVLENLNLEAQILLQNEQVYRERDSLTWCYGLSGLILSRRAIQNQFTEKSISNQINQYIRLLQNNTIDDKLDCLCHGNMGLFDTLIELNKETQLFSQYYSQLKNNVLELKKIRDGQWFTIGINDYKIYDLMTGLSGIVYELLRIRDYKQIPSILLLNFI